MLDIKIIRENPDKIKKGLARKGIGAEAIDEIIRFDGKRRLIIADVENLKSLRNKASQDVAKMKKEGKDASSTIAEMKKVSDDIKSKDENLAAVDKEIDR